MYSSMYTFMHIHMHSLTHIHWYTLIHVNIHSSTLTQSLTHTWTYKLIHTNIHVQHSLTHLYSSLTHLHNLTYSHIHTHSLTHIHKLIHTDFHTLKFTLSHRLVWFWYSRSEYSDPQDSENPGTASCLLPCLILKSSLSALGIQAATVHSHQHPIDGYHPACLALFLCPDW